MKHNCVHKERYEDQSCRFGSAVIGGTTRHVAIHNIHSVEDEWANVAVEVEIEDGKIIQVEGKDSLMFYAAGEISPAPEGWSK